MKVAELRRLAEVLLAVASPRDALADAAASLHALLLAASGLEGSAEESAETPLPSGRALSPVDAGRCTQDPVRTAVFLRGVSAAVDAARERVVDRPVEVVYAGTGPFAPFALPLMARHRPGELRFTLLDVHDRSVASVGRLVERLGFGEYVRALLVADATEYEPPDGTPVDVVVIEAMQRSLGSEPQVAISRQLVRSLGPWGVLVPARIAVDLVLSDPEIETADGVDAGQRAAARVRVGPVFELTKESAGAPVDGEGRLPPVTVTLPVGTERGRQPMLFTRVEVFGPHVLEEGDSGLTSPEALWQVPALPAGTRLEFRYRLGRKPGLTWD